MESEIRHLSRRNLAISCQLSLFLASSLACSRAPCTTRTTSLAPVSQTSKLNHIARSLSLSPALSARPSDKIAIEHLCSTLANKTANASDRIRSIPNAEPIDVFPTDADRGRRHQSMSNSTRVEGQKTTRPRKLDQIALDAPQRVLGGALRNIMARWRQLLGKSGSQRG